MGAVVDAVKDKINMFADDDECWDSNDLEMVNTRGEIMNSAHRYVDGFREPNTPHENDCITADVIVGGEFWAKRAEMTQEIKAAKIAAIKAATEWAKVCSKYGKFPPLLSGKDSAMFSLVYGAFAYGVYASSANTETEAFTVKTEPKRNGCLRATGRMLKVDYGRLGKNMEKAGRTL